jgi:HAD superfamily hydrolase (TIGR01509 family)
MMERSEDRRMPPFKGLLFDVDGVLVDSEVFIAEAAAAMFAELYGVNVDLAEFSPFVGTGEARYLGGVAEARGLAIDLPLAKERTYNLYFEVIRDRMKEVRGASALVKACRRAGVKTAIATSADRKKLEANLREIGLSEDDFDAAVTGLDVARTKPAPDIYLEAARRLGLPPSACLVVEDAIQGIASGKAAGAACAGITTTFSPDRLLAAGALATFPDLSELEPYALGEPAK